MGGEVCLGVLFEERTFRVMLLPAGIVFVTLAMTWFSGIRDDDGPSFVAEEAGQPPLLFISYGMNNVAKEPWSLFLARWYLWHLLVFSVVSFKRRALPQAASWLADLTGLVILVTIWSGYVQTPAAQRLLFGVHLFVGAVMIVVGFLETVIVWRPSPAVSGAFLIGGATFMGVYVVNRSVFELPDSGIPFIQNRWEIPVQWALFLGHLFIVWSRYPAVEAEMLSGEWRPLLPDNVANMLFGRPPRQPAKFDIEGSNSGLEVLFEERTVRMIVVPICGMLVTQVMTVLAVRRAGGEEQTLFLSNALNNYAFEPWSLWMARYFIWHLTIFSIASFKRRALPDSASWVSDLAAALMLLTLWSSYSQTPTPLPERVMFTIHAFYGAFCQIGVVVETVVLWWPNRAFAVTYSFFTVAFIAIWLLQQVSIVSIPDTGIPLIRSRVEIFLQWALFGVHFAVVWYRFPRVEVQMREGVWRPYLPRFLAEILFGDIRGSENISYNPVPGNGLILG